MQETVRRIQVSQWYNLTCGFAKTSQFSIQLAGAVIAWFKRDLTKVTQVKWWTSCCLFTIYISDCIPNKVPADLNTSIHVTGDLFFLRGKEGGADFLRAEACRAYLAWNVIFVLFIPSPPEFWFARHLQGGVDQLAFYNCCLKEVCRRTSLSPMKLQV